MKLRHVYQKPPHDSVILYFGKQEMICKHFLETDNCILILLGVLYYRSYEIEFGKNKEHERNLMVSDYDMGRNWVCVYDTLSKDDLTCEWNGIKTYFLLK